MMEYIKSKFLCLTAVQQHKRCAEILKQVYHVGSGHPIQQKLLEQYQELVEWMGLSPITSSIDYTSQKQISDLYHLHLKEACLNHKEHHLFSYQRRGDSKSASPVWPIDVYLDNLRSAHNVGSIIRTVEAFSFGRIYFSPQTPFIDNPKVQKTAMDCHPWVDCRRGSILSQLRRPIIALETCHSATSLYQFTFPDTFTLVLGNEEYGCSEASLEEANLFVEIPMRGRKNSLNVANAFSCIAAEVSRQKCARRTP